MTSTTTDRRNASKDVAIKGPVACATTANITLSAEQTIDGVTTSSSRVLVKNQTDTTENGIYISGSGSWTRAPDCDGVGDTKTGTLVFVAAGSTNANTLWRVSTSGDPDPGEAMAFTSVSLQGATGATGATGAQGPAGADGTVDLSSLNAETTLAADDLLLIRDTSEGANNSVTPLVLMTITNLLTEETAPAGTTDFIPIYDTSATAARKMLPSNLFKSINDLTEDTTPAGTADFLITYDTSATSAKKVLPSSLYKTINDVTEDTSPDVTADYFIMYDSSASAAKKVLPTNIYKGINDLTADASPDTAADYVVTYDASAGTAKKVLLSAFSGGGAATTTAAGIVELATAAEVATGTDTGRVPSVSVMGSHQSAAKFWVRVHYDGGAGAPAIDDSYNITSITDAGTGQLDITIATDFANDDYCIVASLDGAAPSGTVVGFFKLSSQAVGSFRINTYLPDSGWTITDMAASSAIHAVGFGDQ